MVHLPTKEPEADTAHNRSRWGSGEAKWTHASGGQQGTAIRPGTLHGGGRREWGSTGHTAPPLTVESQVDQLPPAKWSYVPLCALLGCSLHPRCRHSQQKPHLPKGWFRPLPPCCDPPSSPGTLEGESGW